jgi:hypothetical protein
MTRAVNQTSGRAYRLHLQAGDKVVVAPGVHVLAKRYLQFCDHTHRGNTENSLGFSHIDTHV